MRAGALLLVLALAASGCGGDDTPSDPDAGGGREDAGTPRPDAGGDEDAAPSDEDAGTPTPDAGPADPRPMVDRSDPMLVEHMLDPSILDPSVADSIEMQYAQLDTRSEPLGKLVFFLPGANNSPRDWRDHGRKLAEFGFHVVIPHYNNRWGAACSGMGGSCNADTRWEALTGEPVSDAITASRADSAEGRVIVMLEHLRAEDPGGDWGFYLDASGGLRYDRTIIAGISHGASSTGLFASRRTFWRAVMHSGGWGQVGATPATAIEHYYGLSHTGDEQHAAHLDSWENAGMLGAPTSIDGMTAPFGDARRLITSESSTYPHCSVCVHSSSPVDAMDAYLFEPAWRYMYGVAELAP
jgi:hypothetical protein